MKIVIKMGFLLVAVLLVTGCARDESEPQGPDYEINGIKLEAWQNYHSKDTISADVFKLRLSLMSDNDYAAQYGLNPNLKSKITGLAVTLVSPGVWDGITGSDFGRYFVVEDGSHYNSLYETIEQYLAKKQVESLSPLLVFTNQKALTARSDKLVTDTVAVELSVALTIDNNKTFSKQVKAVLIP